MGLFPGDRYLLDDKLISGGMGTVCRAYDRLSNQPVALKRVRVSTDIDQTQGDVSQDILRLSISQEFQTLATLHHPNVIGVLDHGFDTSRQPYFTMQWLENAQSLTEAGERLNAEGKTKLVVDTLRALSYIHRRGVVHRDLKPGNILVDTNGQVKVLDFGLAIQRVGTSPADANEMIGGTFPYMAPELLSEKPATPASDLYAVGVLIYELFVEAATARHRTSLIQNILYGVPDFSSFKSGLSKVLEKLLAKNPENRYMDADTVIQALCTAADIPVPPESIEVRESYLKASTFVGRDQELSRLRAALKDALAGNGSSWLISGESGVGKSRLLEELRMWALVSGALVLRGQGVAGGGLPYQLWRESLRRLILSTEPTDLEASALKEVVPDIEVLLNRIVPDAVPLEGEEAMQRLALTIQDLFRRQKQPIVLLLEDLQWVSESLNPLQFLNRQVGQHHWLIVGTYRTEETPDLPDHLPGMRGLRLERLSEDAVEALSAAMLGEGGKRQDVLTLLKREAGGNTLFMVEVARALAEQAGSLSNVNAMLLPDGISVGGVDAILAWRLSRVPKWAQPALKLAATAGRSLDLAVLNRAIQSYSPDGEALGDDLDLFLTTGANAAVLEAIDGQWRFVHDKLRETLLSMLSRDDLIRLNREIALALEAVYPNDDSRAVQLTQHWQAAGDREKQVYYAWRAAVSSVAHYAHQEADLYLSMALSLTPPEDFSRHYELHRLREQLYHLRGERDLQRNELDVLESLANQLGGVQVAEVWLRRAAYLGVIGNNLKAIEAAQHVIEQEASRNLPDIQAQAYREWGEALLRQAEYPDAQVQLERALALPAISSLVRAYILRSLGVVYVRQNEAERAINNTLQALNLFRALGDRLGEGIALRNIGTMSYLLDRFSEAKAYWESALLLIRELGDRISESHILNNLGALADALDDAEGAFSYTLQALPVKRAIQDRQGEGSCLLNLGLYAIWRGDFKTGQSYSEAARTLFEETGDNLELGQALNNLGVVAASQGDYEIALSFYQQSLANKRALDTPVNESETLNYMSLRELHLENFTAALDYAHQAEAVDQKIENKNETLRAFLLQARALLELGQPDEALSLFHRVEVGCQTGFQRRLAEARTGIASVLLLRGDAANARAATDMPLDYLLRKHAYGLDDPFYVWLICCEVLAATRDVRSIDILNQAHEALQRAAANTVNERLHQSFLANPPSNRSLLRMWAAAHRDKTDSSSIL